jgi:hypothetical protein
VVRLFNGLIATIESPLAVFIDDLDRCGTDYVIELLEGIRTLLREPRMVYVVAADRNWICSSYAKAYSDFAGAVGEPGKPVGHLFLDKVFQISASLPRIPRDLQQSFWETVLSGSPTVDLRSIERNQAQANKQAEETVKGKHTAEELNDTLARAPEDPVAQQACRAAAAIQITSPEAMKFTEHRLRRFSPLLEPNPRSIKRLVNAYGLHQAVNFLEGKTVSPETLARWTIIELRWPLLAEHLAQKPQDIQFLGDSKAAKSEGVPESLVGLFDSKDVKAVATGDDKLGGILDEKSIREIVGT